MRKRTTTAILVLSLVAFQYWATAATNRLDRAMQQIFVEYQTIHASLSGDSTRGVAAAAKKIAALAARIGPVPGTTKRARLYRALPDKIKDAAGELARSNSLAGQRAAFKALSRPMALWATVDQPEGINVVFCSMARASWVQRGKALRNPYYGATMLRCGEVVSGPDRGEPNGSPKSAPSRQHH